jgi:hypothetical protein
MRAVMPSVDLSKKDEINTITISVRDSLFIFELTCPARHRCFRGEVAGGKGKWLSFAFYVDLEGMPSTLEMGREGDAVVCCSV